MTAKLEKPWRQLGGTLQNSLNMLTDPKALYDGFQLLSEGMNSGLAPNAIRPTQVAFARNVTFRGGFPATRPGWKRRPLVFESGTTQSRFEDNLFQMASSFEPIQGGFKLIALVGGRLFRLDVDDGYRVTDLHAKDLPTDLNPTTRLGAWMEDAEGFHITQDGQSAALIYDGATLRRVNPASSVKEIPVGTVTHYNNGRLTVALPQKKSFVVLDLIGGPSGSANYQLRDAILKNTENLFLQGGGEFGLPFAAGEIRAIKGLAILDTSLGQGPTQIGAERGMVSFNAPFDREEWHDLNYPIETVSLLGSGPQSQDSTVLVNGDLWFRARDGIRSYQAARSDFGSWVNTPLSSEVELILRDDDPALLEHGSGVLFDNRLLMTVSPFRVNDHGICHRGLVALDFHSVSGLTTRATPVWDGLWTGLDILKIVPLKDRCFLFALNTSNKIELWELTKADLFDNSTTRIASFIDTASFGFGNKGWSRIELSTGDLWFDDLVGTVNFDVDFWPDQHPCPVDWHAWSIDSKMTSCLSGTCPAPASLRPQYRPRMRLPLPSDSCNGKVNMPLREGFEFQARIAWTGHARIKKLRLVAHEKQEDTAPFCEPSETTDSAGVTCCDSTLYSYRSDA